MAKQALAAVTLVVVVACVISAVVLAGPAASGASTTSYLLKTTLSAKNEVPAAKDALVAKGVFSARLRVAGKKSTFTWHLTFSGLSGRALAAHVHLGVVGKAGPVAIPLCGPCKSVVDGGYTGSYVASATFLKAILHSGAYVNVHTKLNPNGEIRGQIKATAG